MRWLKILLAINGVAFLAYAASNILLPTSYFLEADAPKTAVDAVRVVGITYGALGLIQLGMWWVADRLALQGSASNDPFHQLGLVVAAGNGLVALIYAWLLYRESQTATA